jgi:hypothetical protein
MGAAGSVSQGAAGGFVSKAAAMESLGANFDEARFAANGETGSCL